MKIPFVDLRAQHDELRPEIDSVIKEVIDNSSFIGGPRIEAFESRFAAFCGIPYAVGCASGTDALKLALMAVGVGPNEEVITVPNTFIATVEAIIQVNAVPVFVDIDAETYCLSVEKLVEFLDKGCSLGQDGRLVNLKSGRKVVAILPVHLYGLPADMKPLLELASHYDLKVVEDACQAHGALYSMNGNKYRAGSLSDAAAFSFYPGKNLGAIGEGGAVVTSKIEYIENMRMWRDHGQKKRYFHASPNGWNGRLDTLQAAILDIKLKKLDEWNARRCQAAKWYYEWLSGDNRIILPVAPDGRRHVYHLFVVRLPDRDKAMEILSDSGIGVGLHYPIPLHLQPSFLLLGYKPGDFPESEAASASILSLPMFPHISEEQVDFICKTLRKALDK